MNNDPLPLKILELRAQISELSGTIRRSSAPGSTNAAVNWSDRGRDWQDGAAPLFESRPPKCLQVVIAFGIGPERHLVRQP